MGYLYFYCDVIGYELARRGVRCGATEASGSGRVQRMWAWSDVDPRSTAVSVVYYYAGCWRRQQRKS